MDGCRLCAWYTLRQRDPRGVLREHLSGRVYGHPGYADGTPITTSAVVRRDGQRAWTTTGSAYILEDELGADAVGSARRG